jgi:glutamyl/glutaminyl-tRNA synthetase
MRFHTRIAPTPSGHLHVGNAWSFTLTWLAARASGGTVRLRIDDLDAERARDEYLDDIFASLRWLGLDWDSGPRDTAEFRAAHSQRLRLEGYEAAIAALTAQGRTYACGCSRAEARREAQALGVAVYPGTCRARGLSTGSDATEEHVLRFRMPDDAVSARDENGGAFALHPARDIGDFVLRRRGGDPAYQLASVLDDVAHGVDFVVRGLDLMPSTGAQLALAKALDLPEFARARFWHHDLVRDDAGEKLSKSRGAESLAALRARFPDPAPVFRWFASALGRDASAAASVRSARDLLEGFDPARLSGSTPSSRAPLRLSDFLRSLDA